MIKKYHENIMKELHYNSGLSSLFKSLVPAATVVCIFCGKDVIDLYKVKTVSEDWKVVASDAIANNQPIPDHPVQVVVHTTTSNGTNINTEITGFSGETK